MSIVVVAFVLEFKYLPLVDHCLEVSQMSCGWGITTTVEHLQTVSALYPSSWRVLMPQQHPQGLQQAVLKSWRGIDLSQRLCPFRLSQLLSLPLCYLLVWQLPAILNSVWSPTVQCLMYPLEIRKHPGVCLCYINEETTLLFQTLEI
jgi:hypothetical protein